MMKLMNTKFLFLSLILVSGLFVDGFSQAKKRKLPATINRLTIMNHAPFVSGDGNSLLYLSDHSNEREFVLRYTSKVGMSTWKKPEDVSSLANSPKIAYQGGYSLNFDGSILYHTFRKHPSVGGYDIWYSTRQGDGWSTPKNDGKPLNTTGHEGAPSVSADGQFMYFMRCDQMSYGSASGCKLYVSKRKGRSWTEAKAMPDVINQGNTMMPRIMADGKTLIFSSNRSGGKGGMDFYLTKNEGGVWSSPRALDFLNTEKDDLYLSVASKGRYLLHTVADGRGGAYIEELLIPDDFKPSKVMRVSGQVIDGNSGSPVQAKVKAYTIGSRDRVWDDVTDTDGSFAVVLEEGQQYDFSIESKEKGYTYYSKLYDLEEMKYSKRDEMEVRLLPISSNSELPLSNINFEQYSADLSDASTYELRRLVRLLKGNPQQAFELDLTVAGYRQDSLQSDPDLTEVHIDTVYTEYTDTALLEDDGDVMGSSDNDGDIEEMNKDNDEMESSAASEKRMELKYTYHNDRSEKQSERLMDYLMKKGIGADRLRIQTSREAKSTEGGEAQTLVKLKVL